MTRELLEQVVIGAEQGYDSVDEILGMLLDALDVMGEAKTPEEIELRESVSAVRHSTKSLRRRFKKLTAAAERVSAQAGA